VRRIWWKLTQKVALTHNSVKNNECDVTYVLKEPRRRSKCVIHKHDVPIALSTSPSTQVSRDPYSWKNLIFYCDCISSQSHPSQFVTSLRVAWSLLISRAVWNPVCSIQEMMIRRPSADSGLAIWKLQHFTPNSRCSPDTPPNTSLAFQCGLMPQPEAALPRFYCHRCTHHIVHSSYSRHAQLAMYPGVMPVVWRSDTIPQVGLDARHALSAMYPGVMSVVWRSDTIPQVGLDARHALSAMYPGVMSVVWRSDTIPHVGLSVLKLCFVNLLVIDFLTSYVSSTTVSIFTTAPLLQAQLFPNNFYNVSIG
jgi:hypothetical protein